MRHAVELNVRDYVAADQAIAKANATEREPLLVLHGLFGHQGNWGLHCKALAERYRVIGVDLRNHGESPHAPELDYQAMAEDVRLLIETRGLGACTVLGHSMGGKVAMQLALSYPALVKRLIIVDIAPVAYQSMGPGHHRVIEGMMTLDLTTAVKRADAEAHLAKHIEDEATLKFIMTNLARAEGGGLRWKLNVAAIKEQYDRLREKPEGDAPFDKPVLFVKGSESGYIGAEHEQEILALFPQASVKIVMEAGHWVHADKPQAFQKIVFDFLEATDA